MNAKLFIVCPFSCMANFIRNKYGEDVFFISAMETVFQFDEKEHLESVKYFVERENINDVNIVSDTSCRFINFQLKMKYAMVAILKL